MALHGDIRVNGRLLGTWAAVRTVRLSDGVHLYDCDVQWGFNLRKPGSRYTFQLAHRYSDGATKLASAVLAKAADVAPPPPPLMPLPAPDPVVPSD